MAHEVWVRYRFYSSSIDDPRPVIFPPPGPYWESGFNDTHAILIAYLPKGVNLTTYWPEAEQVEEEGCAEIIYTDRFPKPDWYKP